MPVAAKCASHAYGEFNLATPKELFSYEAEQNNLALNFVLKSDRIKTLLIKSVIMLTAFIILAIIDLRGQIGLLTNNETIVLGVNFLGDAIWISHYLGCIMGMIAI